MKTSSRSELGGIEPMTATKQVHATQPLAPAIEPEEQPAPDVYGFVKDFTGCTFHHGLHMHELTISAPEGCKLGLNFSNHLPDLWRERAALRDALAEIIRIGFTSTDDTQARDQMLALARAAIGGEQ